MNNNSLRQRLSSTLRSTAFWRKASAKRLALSAKRLDVCAGQLAHVLHLAGLDSLEGKTCVEIGAGSVMSHSLLFHLLGAEVVATDIEALATAEAARTAVRSATASIVRDVLSPFADHEAIRHRLDRLFDWEGSALKDLEARGIRYIAPLDLAKSTLGVPMDFVYSNSVLEHVPPEDLSALTAHLLTDLRPGGTMFHAIHLEDHQDHAMRPFDFLTDDGLPYTGSFGSRGNRIRPSTWLKLLGNLPHIECRVLYQWRRSKELLPARIDPDVAHTGVDDLRTSHLGIFLRRTA